MHKWLLTKKILPLMMTASLMTGSGSVFAPGQEMGAIKEVKTRTYSAMEAEEREAVVMDGEQTAEESAVSEENTGVRAKVNTAEDSEKQNQSYSDQAAAEQAADIETNGTDRLEETGDEISETDQASDDMDQTQDDREKTSDDKEETRYEIHLDSDAAYVQVKTSAKRKTVLPSNGTDDDLELCEELLKEEDLVIVNLQQEDAPILDSEELLEISQSFQELPETDAKTESDTAGNSAASELSGEVALTDENLLDSYLAGTTVYFSAVPDMDYEMVKIELIGEDGSPIESKPDQTEGVYSFVMPDQNVLIKTEAEEIQLEGDYSEEEILALSDYMEEQGLSVSNVELMSVAMASQLRTITVSMDGFVDYSAEGYGSGFDAVFTVHPSNYQGNGNAYCLNPALQAPGHNSQGQRISYTTTVTDYTDPMLIKILYYGFGGPGNITNAYASTPTAQHILTHMVSVRRAAELGIPGAGSYTYKASSTAIRAADALYNAIKNQPEIIGTVSVLTPVQGQQTIMLLANYQPPKVNGQLRLTKISARVELSDGNPNYSLKGAGYVVCSDQEMQHLVGTFTTNADGTSSVTMTLEPGTYYVKEVTVPKGYLLDETIYTATVEAGVMNTVLTKDVPAADNLSLLLEKVNAETGEADETLQGAQFTMNYYAVEEEADLQTPTASWVFETDEHGQIFLADSYKVGGDPLILNKEGQPVLPLGYLTIQETKAPAGYELNDTLYLCHTEKTDAGVETTNLPTGEHAVREQPHTSELAVTKLVTGSAGNKTKEFSFTLQLTTISEQIIPRRLAYIVTETGAEDIKGYMDLDAGTVSFQLRHGQTIHFTDIPSEFHYEVVETDGEAEGYTVTYENASGQMTGETVHVKVTNHKDMIISTDADTNSPILTCLLLAAFAGFILLFFKTGRRRFMNR